ncbi:MAG: carboxymuconolactone decarboxylase family protein [Acidaminococcaceae bacterium]|jgi:4-carboxymuconolactone decarboxylase|nr:carboxymuconolactone decarboxylase family protein [Acidaminococcaceae bacterium]
MTTSKIDRVQLTAARVRKIYPGIISPLVETDPDFDRTFHRFLLGEVQQHGHLLTDQQKALLAIVTLTATQKYNFLPIQVEGALNAGTTPVQIKEALYQIAPYVGFPNVVEALGIVNKIFQQRGIKLPLENQSTVDEATRLDKGIAVQTQIFGEQIPRMRAAAPENLQHIQDYLSAFCFGDTYTRKTLNLQDREMLTLCAIASLGGCEPQLKAHIQGNVNVGNTKEILLEALTQCLPYIGFPRTLNALGCLSQVLPDKK